jgi:hypothetical protein
VSGSDTIDFLLSAEREICMRHCGIRVFFANLFVGCERLDEFIDSAAAAAAAAVSCKVGECDARARSETYPRPLTLFGRLRQTKHFKLIINNNGYWFDFLT